MLLVAAVFSWRSVLASNEEVRSFIEEFMSETVETFSVQKISDATIERVRDSFERNFDHQWVSSYIMGDLIGSATPYQKGRLMESYKMYIIYSYLPLFHKYDTIGYTVKSVHNVKGQHYVVSVNLNCRNCPGNRTNIVYRVKYDKGRYLIYDIIFEGVGFLVSERNDFKVIAGTTSSIDGLIQKLEKENRKLYYSLVG